MANAVIKTAIYGMIFLILILFVVIIGCKNTKTFPQISINCLFFYDFIVI